MSNNLKAIIIDDEPLARKTLNRLIMPYADQIDLLAEASNGEEGLKLIEELKPDVVFLDIKMPVLNGFEMLERLSFQPYIIFTTAHDEYALAAFEKNSIDFLLKPLTADRIKLMVDKIGNFKSLGQNIRFDKKMIRDLIGEINKPSSIRTLKVAIGDRIQIINIQSIVYFKAEDKLTKIVTSNGRSYYFDPSLKKLEEKLPENFIRLNRSHIINENYVTEIKKSFKGKLIYQMKTDQKTKITSSPAYISSIRKSWGF